jgi:hypothetical protein
MREAGKQCGIKDSAARNLKMRIAEDLIEFFGSDVIRRLLDGVCPDWTSNLRATRERHLNQSEPVEHRPHYRTAVTCLSNQKNVSHPCGVFLAIGSIPAFILLSNLLSKELLAATVRRMASTASMDEDVVSIRFWARTYAEGA